MNTLDEYRNDLIASAFALVWQVSVPPAHPIPDA